MSMHPDLIQRHADGSINFDRYRSDATALRRQSMLDTSKLSAAFKLVVIVVLTLSAVAVAPSKHDANATCHTCSDVRAAGERNPSVMPSVRSQWTPVPQHPPLY